MFVSLEALSALEALGDKAYLIKDFLRTMPQEDPNAAARATGYMPRLLEHFLGEDAKPAAARKPRKAKR